MLVCERAILRDKVKDKSTENKKQILKFEKNDEKWKGQNERTGIGIETISKEQRKGKLVMFSSVWHKGERIKCTCQILTN